MAAAMVACLGQRTIKKGRSDVKQYPVPVALNNGQFKPMDTSHPKLCVASRSGKHMTETRALYRSYGRMVVSEDCEKMQKPKMIHQDA